ncbi:MAG TPA: DMT family transporter [Bacillota bacterium]|nr:DMT family transporter [Peptococcaceae bacterium]HPU35572.1 DMT family transporter [Bacillota bacterium]
MKYESTAINPYLGIILAVIAVSFSSIFTKLAAAPPLAIAFYRLFFTVLLLAPLSLNAAGRAEFTRISRRDVFLAFISGAFLALHFTVWISSLNYTSVASSTVLVTLQPLFVITGGFFFFKEKISRKGLAGIALALTGSILIGINDFRIGGKALFGDLLAFSGAFFVAVYFLIGRSLRGRLSLFPYVFLVYGTTSLFLLIFNVATATPLYPYPWQDWLWFFLLALVPTILGHTVFNWALRYVQAAVVSVSILGEPVGATILAYFIFQEIPGLLQLAGGLTIILGLYIFITSSFIQDK